MENLFITVLVELLITLIIHILMFPTFKMAKYLSKVFNGHGNALKVTVGIPTICIIITIIIYVVKSVN